MRADLKVTARAALAFVATIREGAASTSHSDLRSSDLLASRTLGKSRRHGVGRRVSMSFAENLLGVRWQDRHCSSETFDAAVCQFGVMFFPDKPASLRDVLRVLRPGGMYVFNVWDSLDHNPLAHVADQVSRSMFPSYQPAGHAIPFAYHDRDTIRRDLTSAGFNEPRFEIVQQLGRASSAQLAAAAYIHGGILRHEIDRQGPGALEHATAAVSQTLSARFGDGEVSIPNQAVMVIVVRP